MSLGANIRYQFMKDLGAPALFKLNDAMKKKRPHKPNDLFAPPLKCTARLKEIMTRHYFLARYAPGAKPVAWVTSGAPVELLRVFGFYTFYPENHGAMCGASRMAPDLCQIAEEHGYNRDVCSYAAVTWDTTSPARPRPASCPSRRCCSRPTTSARPCSTGTRPWRIITTSP